jgi:hypothetical protein
MNQEDGGAMVIAVSFLSPQRICTAKHCGIKWECGLSKLAFTNILPAQTSRIKIATNSAAYQPYFGDSVRHATPIYKDFHNKATTRVFLPVARDKGCGQRVYKRSLLLLVQRTLMKDARQGLQSFVGDAIQ